MSGADGRFVWAELMTDDPEAAAAFYADVVGWTVTDFGPANPEYKIVSAGTHGVGGIMALPAEARAAGARPGWFGYIHVPDVDEAARRIVDAGGVLHRPAMDLEQVGRIAMVSDPGGAVFSLIAPTPQEGEWEEPDPQAPGLVSWHELAAGQGEEAAMAFYGEQFGWETIDLMDMGPMGKYRIFGRGDRQMGGMIDKPDGMAKAGWLSYFNVDGIDPAIDRIKAGGGTVQMGPHEVPGGSWIVQAVDPQGAAFALVSPTREESVR